MRPMLCEFPAVPLIHTMSNTLSYSVTFQPLRELSCSAHQSKLMSGLRHLGQENRRGLVRSCGRHIENLLLLGNLVVIESIFWAEVVHTCANSRSAIYWSLFHFNEVMPSPPSSLQVGPPQPLAGGETPAELRKRLKAMLQAFTDEAPFTLQRLCELLLEPSKQYTRLDKLVRNYKP